MIAERTRSEVRASSEVSEMNPQISAMTLGVLPEPATRWDRFFVGYGMQTLVMAFFVITAIMHPELRAWRFTFAMSWAAS